MRLTLRTLLAYLDDTLEPLEIKKIGQKIADSDTAQELIARIKQVTRRRRIATPPATGPNSFDPNMVADYLDSELPPEKIAELEKICLESDVHLAEVASCHQILTLVLGEPATVPPTAKERMYALVHGREAIPFRKASTSNNNSTTSSAGEHDADDMLLLGLPLYRRGSWLRWALPLAGVVLLAIVGVALWQSVSGLQDQPLTSKRVAKSTASVANVDKEKTDKTAPTETTTPPKTNNENIKLKETKNNSTAKTTPDTPTPKKNIEESTPKDTKEIKPPEKVVETNPAARTAKPSSERLKVGSYILGPSGQPSILLQRKEDGWHRRTARDHLVFTREPLVSLPGYASEVKLDSGVRLLLRGHVREFSLFAEMNYLQESSVVLHKCGKDVDADLTLKSGRLFLSNAKGSGAAVVRLRFENEVWDVTLKESGAEVVVDLLKRYRGDVDYLKGEPPVATLAFFVLKGKVGLVAGLQHFPLLSAPPGKAAFLWGNKGSEAGLHGPSDQASVPIYFRVTLPIDPKKNPDAEKMKTALEALHLRMLPDKDPTVVLREELSSFDDLMRHRLAIYSLGGLDEINVLLEQLADPDQRHNQERQMAILTLHHWLAQDAQNGKRLFDPEKNSGILRDQKMYTGVEAERIFTLLHDMDEEQALSVETYDKLAHDLISDKVAIAELARWNLYILANFQGVKLPSLDRFNAASPREERQLAYKEVRDKIEQGKLPFRGTIPGGGNNAALPNNRPQPKSKTPNAPKRGGFQ